MMIKKLLNKFRNEINARMLQKRRNLMGSELMVENERFSIYRYWKKEDCTHVGFILLDKRDGISDFYKGSLHDFIVYIINNYKDIYSLTYDGKSLAINS